MKEILEMKRTHEKFYKRMQSKILKEKNMMPETDITITKDSLQ